MSGVQLEVRHTLDALQARLQLLPGERMAAAVRALNRTMTTVRAEGARSLAKQYPGLKISAIKGRLKIQRATSSTPWAAVVFSGKRIGLYGNFGMRGIGKWGVGFRGLPWRLETVSGDPVTPDMLARAFRQRARGGRATVFSRLGRQRLPIDVLVAPGVARAFAERGIDEVLRRIAVERFSVVFQQEANFRLSKR